MNVQHNTNDVSITALPRIGVETELKKIDSTNRKKTITTNIPVNNKKTNKVSSLTIH